MTSNANDDEWQDIMGGGVVLKRTVREGTGPTPEFKSLAYVHYVGRVQGKDKDAEPFENTREAGKGQPVEVTIGDNVLEEVVPGLTLAVRLMKEGEVADVKVNHRFAYAHLGLGDKVKPNEDVEFRVELVRVDDPEKEPVDMTPEELIGSVRKRKERGNYFFEQGRLDKALQCYQDGLKRSESHLPTSQPQQPGQEEPPQEEKPMSEEDFANDPYNSNPDLIQLRAQCAGNAAACFERQEKWKEASDACVAALSLDPHNLKFLLRAANISMMNGNFEEAKACLGAAKDFHPDSPALARAVRKFKDHVNKHKAKQKATFGGFFNKTSADVRTAESQSVPSGTSKPAGNAPEAATATLGIAASGDEPQDTAQQAVPKSSKSQIVSVNVVHKLLRLAVLLAPTLVALLAFLLIAPARAQSLAHMPLSRSPTHAGPWANLSDDGALIALRSASFGDELSCQGRMQRASCCLCQEMMYQASARQAKAREAHPQRKVQVGFRLGQKQYVPFHLSEEVALTILERVCGRLPLDIPATYEDLPWAKHVIIEACNVLLDTFHDDFLELLTQPVPARSSLGAEACVKRIGVCAARPLWQVSLRSFGNAYLTLPCSVCTGTTALLAHALSAAGSVSDVKALLRDPATLCADLSLELVSDPSRVAELSRAIGDACIDILLENKAEILRIADASSEVCPQELSKLLCVAHCPASTFETIA
ncbi:Peptidyl-prolyl cis-trans isomerase FKBP42 [Hondaea fermentalgiana]|uniref:peptidylprolyl isomerase n=1 Tax=Hondaea fermentalgiana TaxID=2315210 RepID=A0A2R5GLQ6_9STRA|nr:Peptidyl-prolyl cis-trans isomerase FKBP42 [Hondaea fermentalgiana]|eukprot:GBG31810.1 Peptidyl-prolyl cis-trans isomerase FKBP42 [Hondaea fermentalgiana]